MEQRRRAWHDYDRSIGFDLSILNRFHDIITLPAHISIFPSPAWPELVWLCRLSNSCKLTGLSIPSKQFSPGVVRQAFDGTRKKKTRLRLSRTRLPIAIWLFFGHVGESRPWTLCVLHLGLS